MTFTDGDGERLDDLRELIAGSLGDDDVILEHQVAEYNRLIKKLWEAETEECLSRAKSKKP